MNRRAPVKELRNDAIDVKPQNVSWSDMGSEAWEYYAADRCQTCNKIVYNVRGEEQHQYLEEVNCDGYLNADGPMMNYDYALPASFASRWDLDEAQKAILHLPLCIVEWNEDSGREGYSLALTGGGMDLSWEICEAYMRLGYLPPVHFTLPRMCGRGVSHLDRWIMAGVRKANRVMINWMRSNLRDVKATATWCREFNEKEKAQATA